MRLIHAVTNALRRRTIQFQKELSQGESSQIIPSTSEVEPPDPPDRESLIALVNSFPYWYQRIYLGRGVYTLPALKLHNHIWQATEALLSEGFKGANVLDLGTNAGYFCIQAKLRGAGQVIGVDFDERCLKQAEACRSIWKFDIDYRQVDIDQLQLHTLGQRFDVVIFTGILYHLKNPLGVLEQVASLCDDAIVVETETLSPKHPNVLYVRQGPPERIAVTPCSTGFMKFIEKDELNGDGSNWWVPDEACVLGMLRTVGFKYFSKPRYLKETRMFVVASKKPHSLFRLA